MLPLLCDGRHIIFLNVNLCWHCYYWDVATFGVTMTLEWDEAKNRANIRKHGFDFVDAEEMFRGAPLIQPDISQDYGEERWIGIGMIQGRVAFVTSAERPPDTIRI